MRLGAVHKRTSARVVIYNRGRKTIAQDIRYICMCAGKCQCVCVCTTTQMGTDDATSWLPLLLVTSAVQCAMLRAPFLRIALQSDWQWSVCPRRYGHW